MKSTKLVIASLLVIAAVAYAAKTPEVFTDGLEGFTKPATVPTVSTDVHGHTVVDFGDMTAKGSIQFTKVTAPNVVVKVSNAKAVSQKGGKVIGDLAGVDVTGCAQVSLKLKGIAVGTVLASDLKMAQVADVTSVLAGPVVKGATVKATEGVGGGVLTGSFKSIAAGWFEDTDATGVTTPKSLSLKAKSNQNGKVLVSSTLVYKAKNVDVVVED